MELISLYSSRKRKPDGCSGEGREFDDGVLEMVVTMRLISLQQFSWERVRSSGLFEKYSSLMQTLFFVNNST